MLIIAFLGIATAQWNELADKLFNETFFSDGYHLDDYDSIERSDPVSDNNSVARRYEDFDLTIDSVTGGIIDPHNLWQYGCHCFQHSDRPQAMISKINFFSFSKFSVS
jgi:hypothetical protein